jgi:hypothetical protein
VKNCTFGDLHEAIFNAFDRYDPHLYSFFITKSDTRDVRSIWRAPEITHPQNTEDLIGFGEKKRSTLNTKIGNVGLVEKDVFHYLFDFGDDWWHRIRVQAIKDSGKKRKSIKIIISAVYSATIRGWMQYYGRYYTREFYPLLAYINMVLVRRAYQKSVGCKPESFHADKICRTRVRAE